MRRITSLCFLLGLPLFYKDEERRRQTIFPHRTFNCVLVKYKYTATLSPFPSPLAYSLFITMFILCSKQKRRRPYFSLTYIAWRFFSKFRTLGKQGSRDEGYQSRGEPERKTTEKPFLASPSFAALCARVQIA